MRLSDGLPWLGQYVLDERGNPMPANSLDEWSAWFGTHERHVALTEFAWGRVSTVFLGLDHNFLGSPVDDPLGYKPVLWETMVFGGPLDQEMRRYNSREEAENGHRETVERCLAGAENEDDRIAVEKVGESVGCGKKESRG